MIVNDIQASELAGNCNVAISSGTSTSYYEAALRFQHGLTDRWAWEKDNVSTHDLYLRRYDIDGVLVDSPIKIDWTTGAVTQSTASLTSLNVGTANTGTTAVERGDGHNHTTVLTVSTTLPAIAGGADLAVGKLLYTFPSGAIIVNSAYMSIGITQTQAHINADTPDGGLGTVIASGAVATLDGTGTFENIITGQTFANCTGTAKVKTAIPTAGASFTIEIGEAHTIYFNVADGWAVSGDAAALLAGTVILNWSFII
jgi:hypothetical protein